jgi:hypothetical protein
VADTLQDSVGKVSLTGERGSCETQMATFQNLWTLSCGCRLNNSGDM